MILNETRLGAEVVFSPRWWTFISSTRIFVASFFGHSYGDEDFSDRVAMAAHELLENAAKYSSSMDASIRCSFSVQDHFVRVEVQNHAHHEHLPILQEDFLEVTQGDPLEVYIQRMQRSVTSEKSQLGLARIRYEGAATLGLAVENDTVIMEALFALPELKG